jgi:polyisoprenoid-binding protein YceI
LQYAARYAVVRRCLLALALALSSSAAPPASAYPTDPAVALSTRYRLLNERSIVALTVPMIGHMHLRMRFNRVDAELERADGASSDPRVSVTIDAASVEASRFYATPIVKSRALLDVAHFPQIRFSSTRFIRTADDRGLLIGDLTIRGTTRPIALAVTIERAPSGTLSDSGLLAFAAEGHFSRAAFGLTAWSATIGDDIHMMIRAAFVRCACSR